MNLINHAKHRRFSTLPRLALLLAALLLLHGCGSAAQSKATVPASTAAQTTVTQSQPPAHRFAPAPNGYFAQTLIIGDSRTEDLLNYNALTAPTIFSRVSTSVYNLHSEPANVNNGVGEILFSDLLQSRQFQRIYVMLGFNEIGYDRMQTVEQYRALIEELRAAQPEALILVEANLHVTATYAQRHPEESNAEIDDFNNRIAKLADQEHVFYLDLNPLFDDANGALDPQYTNDGVHLTPQATRTWAAWLEENALL